MSLNPPGPAPDGPKDPLAAPPAATQSQPKPATQAKTTRQTAGHGLKPKFSADYLKSPGDDRRLDITDVFLFKSSKDPDKMMLIVNSNPTAPAPAPIQARGPEFYPGAVYRINVDTDGDAHADVAFTFTFSEYHGGAQTGTAWYATGPQARSPEPAGEVLAESIPVSFDGMAPPVQAGRIRLLAGRRSDPFFADIEGTLHGFAWTGHDDFAGNNVSSIILEVPADMLFTGPQIGIWASISRRRPDGTLEQMDRDGNPTLNPFINPDGEKDLYNSRQPADDVANYMSSGTTSTLGGTDHGVFGHYDHPRSGRNVTKSGQRCARPRGRPFARARGVRTPAPAVASSAPARRMVHPRAVRRRRRR